jgi:glycosyltransferase involved in cell wall biosynthesis
MKVSIITVAFNAFNTIRVALESVLAQDYTNLEYIVVDGGSGDGTQDIINEYSHKITKFISEPDKGIYDAMNKGIQLSTGDFIAFLNADDFYGHDKVISLVAKALHESSADVLYGDLVYVDKEDTNKIVRFWKSGDYKPGDFLGGWMPPHPTFFARRDLFILYGNFNLKLKSSADYELMLRFIHIKKAKVAYLPEVLVKMRIGGASNGSLSQRMWANREDALAWELNNIPKPRFLRIMKPMKKLFQYISR